jgi:hypothetical protein
VTKFSSVCRDCPLPPGYSRLLSPVKDDENRPGSHTHNSPAKLMSPIALSRSIRHCPRRYCSGENFEKTLIGVVIRFSRTDCVNVIQTEFDSEICLLHQLIFQLISDIPPWWLVFFLFWSNVIVLPCSSSDFCSYSYSYCSYCSCYFQESRCSFPIISILQK